MHLSHRRRASGPGPAPQGAARRRASAAREGAGNHARLDVRRIPDAHERQAEAAATDFLRGRAELARRLTPAPAATPDVPSSTGRPLPGALRKELEAGFGADLGRVRIHTDAGAAAAARREHARAFTAGAHVFFDAGAYRPGTEPGRRLLAHEVAHVLQQTGRRTTDGQLGATDAAGPGEVQCAGYPGFPELRRLHRPTRTSDRTAYDAVAAHLASLVGGNPAWQDDPAIATAIETYAATVRTPGSGAASGTIAGWPAEAESLLYDTLKAVGKLDAAVALLERDDYAGAARIWTVREDAEVSRRLEEIRDPKKLDTLLGRLGSTRFAWTFELRRLTYHYLFQPIDVEIDEVGTRRPPASPRTTSGLKEFEKQPFVRLDACTSALEAELADTGRISENEWNRAALAVLAAIDVRRQNAFVEAHNRAVDPRPEFDVDYMRKRAEGLRDAFVRIQNKPSDFLEAALGERVQHQLLAVVEAALGVFAEAEASLRATSTSEIAEDLHVYAEDPALQGQAAPLRANLQALATALADSSAEGLFPPTDARFPAGAATFAEKIAGDGLARLASSLSKQFWLSAAQDRREAQRRLVQGMLLVHKAAEGVVTRLRWAAEKRDPDEATYSFINLARYGSILAKRMRWPDVEAAFGRALEPEDRTLISIRGDWVIDHRSLSGLLEDFSSTERVGGLDFLTFGQLVILLEARYYRELAGELKGLLPDPKDRQDARSEIHSAVHAEKYVPALNQAYQLLKDQNRLPARWKPEKGWDVALARGTAGDKGAGACGAEDAPPRTFRCALKRHEKVVAWQKAEHAEGRLTLLPWSPANGIFGWAFVLPNAIATLLSGNAFLRKVVAAHLERTGASESEPEVRKDGTRWLSLLLAATQELVRVAAQTDSAGNPTAEAKAALEQLGLLDAAVQGLVEDERSDAFKVFRNEHQRALAMHREIVVERTIRPLLQSYQGEGRIRNWQAPLQALRQVRQFYHPGAPPEATGFAKEQHEAYAVDYGLQLAVLMLQIAPDMAAAFKYERRVDVLSGYLPLLRAALDTVRTRGVGVADLARLFHEDRGVAWIAGRRGELQTVFERMEAAAARHLGGKGIVGDREKNVLYSTAFGPAVKTGVTHLIRGIEYTFERVVVDFEYHPPLLSGSAVAQPAVLVDPKTEAPIADDVVLFVYSERDPETNAERRDVEVRGRDVGLLMRLQEALAWQAFGQTLENIEKLAELGIEVISWIPGIGQFVDTGRALAAIADFFVSGTYEDVKELLTGGLQEVLDGFIEDVHAALTPERLVLFLLFGNATLDRLLAQADEAGKPSGGRRPRGGGGFAAARRAVEALKRVAYGVKNRLEMLQGRVQSPVRGVRAFVLARPAVRTVLRLAEQNIYFLGAVTNPPKVELADGRALGERLDGLVDTLGGLELPKEVIDAKGIIAAVLHELLLFVGKRLGLKGRAVTAVLEFVGVLDLVTQRIGDEIVDRGFDPNVYWRDTVVPAIQADFDAARTELVAALQRVLSSPALGAPATLAAAAPSAFALDEGSFAETQFEVDPEAQPYTAEGMPEPGPAGPLPEVCGGRPLTQAERDDLEARFGHDFGHVRLHTGDAARAMAEATGAEGVTSGSHIYLRPGLSPHSTLGREVLLHELAHVLQQTGGRPLGGTYDARPSAGRPGLGLRLHPDQERAARRAAVLARIPHPNQPIDFGDEDQEGLQPALPFSVIRQILSNLTSVEEVESDRASIDERIARSGRQVDPAIDATIQAVTSAVAAPGMPTAFTSVGTQIKTLLQPGTPALSTVAHLIARDSRMTVTIGRGKTAREVEVVDLNTFTMRFQDYVLGRTGVLIRIDWKTTKGEPTADSFFEPGRRGRGERVDAANPAQVEVVHLHLPFIAPQGTGGEIWDALVNAHWGKRPTDLKRARSMLRIYLRSVGPDVRTFRTSGREFKLTKHAYERVEALVRAGGAVSGVPTIDQYAEPDPTKAPTGDLARIGVRLANHKDQSPIGAERESHHLTQYLLVEYFHNLKSQQPFLGGLRYPGKMIFDETRLTSIEDPSGGPILDLKKQNTGGRGMGMPAISLSAATHQTGDLHIHGQPDDATTNPPSQGNAIHMQFQAHLPELKTAKAFADYRRKAGATEAARDAAVHGEIYAAMQDTYAWMRDFMRDRLKRNVPKLEADYYAGLRDRFTPGNQLSAQERSTLEKKLVRVVGDDVVGKMNDEMMATLGWPTP